MAKISGRKDPPDERVEWLGQVLARWVSGAIRWSWLTLVGAMLVAGGGLYLASERLGVNTSTEEMFSLALDWRQDHREFRDAFPHFGETLLVVIDGDIPDLADNAQQRLSDALAREKALFEWVYAPGGSGFFRRNALLYLTPDEVADVVDSAARAQPILARIVDDPSAKGVFNLLADIERAGEKVGGAESAELTRTITGAALAAADGRFSPVSWAELGAPGESRAGEISDVTGTQSTSLRGSVDSSDTRRFVIARPFQDFSDLLPAKAALAAVRATVKSLGLTPENGVRIRITGAAALAHEELQSVTRGATNAGLGAFIGVAIVLAWGLRSWRLVTAALVTLVVGLSWTAGFAAVVVGDLNLISVAFVVLYIGLGIDYAIHYCLRVRELSHEGVGYRTALVASAADVGRSLVICTITTGGAFFAFVPSDFSGVSELGLISGAGMFISLAVSLTVLPASLALLGSSPVRAPSRRERAGEPSPSGRGWTERWRWPVFSVTVLGLLGAGIVLPRLNFDANPMNLRNPASESVSTYMELMADASSAPWAANVLVDSQPAAALLAERAEALITVSNARQLASLVPSQQSAKLDLIDELDLVLGPLVSDLPGDSVGTAGAAQAEQAAGARPDEEAAMQNAAALDDLLSLYGTPLSHPPSPLRAALVDALATLQRGGEGAMVLFERNVLAMFHVQMDRLANLVEAEPVTLKTIPPETVRRWLTADGRFRVRIEPTANLNDPEALRAFVMEVQSIAPRATGTPVLNLEASQAVFVAFTTAFAYAFVFIAIVLVVMFRSIVDAALILGAVLLGTLFATGVLLGVGLQFNFANVIALPLMLGIGVDNGIHILNRLRMADVAVADVLRTSTARAVAASALTTICGFGNLAFSEHLGMASMGILLTLGLGFSLLCTLVLLPVLHSWVSELSRVREA